MFPSQHAAKVELYSSAFDLTFARNPESDPLDPAPFPFDAVGDGDGLAEPLGIDAVIERGSLLPVDPGAGGGSAVGDVTVDGTGDPGGGINGATAWSSRSRRMHSVVRDASSSESASSVTGGARSCDFNMGRSTAAPGMSLIAARSSNSDRLGGRRARGGCLVMVKTKDGGQMVGF